jgi:hypothetical protein
MIDHDCVKRTVKDFDAWVGKQRLEWQSYRYAFEDKFWSDKGGRAADGTAGFKEEIIAGYPVKVQINHIRPWVFSFVDSLFHKGLRSIVSSPTLPRGKAKDIVGPEGVDEVKPKAMLSKLLDFWMRRVEIEETTERAFIMGMLYPEIGLKLGIDDTIIGEKGHPIESIWVDALPPWECLWDRRARSLRQLRYIGHVYWVSREELLSRFPDIKPDDVCPTIAPDTVEEGPERTRANALNELRDDQMVRILEFFDLTCGDDKDSEFRVYLLEGGKGETEKPVFAGPMPFSDVTGKSLPSIIPAIFVNVPEHPLRGIPPVGSLFGLNSEENYAHTFLINAARRDSARHLMVDKEMIDEEALSNMTDGQDQSVVPVDTQGKDLTKGMHWVEHQPVSSTLLQVMNALSVARDNVAGKSQLGRGEAIKYASAAEVHSLVAYDESTLGRIRKRMDVTVVALLKLFVRVLATAMDLAKEKSITVLVEDKEVTVERWWLDEDWEIALVDAASTPMAEAQKRQDFQQISQSLLELYAEVQNGNAMAKVMIKYMVDIFDLPKDMSVEALAAPPPTPPVEATPVGPPAPVAAGPAPVMPPMPAGPPMADVNPAAALQAAVAAGQVA